MEKSVVVMTTYNGEKYIIEQLESILLQTKKVDTVYIFDDLSTDNTPQMVVDFIKGHKLCWKFVRNSEKKGWIKNFIEALSSVDAEYIFIADQDDIWMKDKTEKMVSILDENSEILLLASNYELLYSANSHTKEKNAEIRRLKHDGKLEKIKKMKKKFYIRQPGCTFCLRKKLLDLALPLWVNDFPHDALLWQVALLKDSLYSINEPLIEWRRHDTNASNKKIQTKDSRIQRVVADYNFINSKQFLDSDDTFLLTVRKFFVMRKKMFEKNSLKLWIIIFLKYRKFYVSLKSCFGDLYFLIKG